MVSSGDVPSNFNLASFFVRPDFRVFQHNPPIPAVRVSVLQQDKSTPLRYFCPRRWIYVKDGIGRFARL